VVAKPGLLLKKKDEAQINIWERKVLRRMFGPVNDRGIWLRLRWLGQVCRMEGQRYLKTALEGKHGGRRKRGKPRTRWIDIVKDDLRKMGIKELQEL
jgi:hypothetical protein